MKRTITMLAVALMAFGLVAAKKDRDWKTGTLEETIRTTGTSPSPQVVVTGSSASQHPPLTLPPRTVVVQGYRIEGNGYSFMVSCDIIRGKVPNVTVHGPVKYALEDGKFYLLDEDGREFKATVLEKALLPVPSKP